jgi:hypothetical protein
MQDFCHVSLYKSRVTEHIIDMNICTLRKNTLNQAIF